MVTRDSAPSALVEAQFSEPLPFLTLLTPLQTCVPVLAVVRLYSPLTLSIPLSSHPSPFADTPFLPKKVDFSSHRVVEISVSRWVGWTLQLRLRRRVSFEITKHFSEVARVLVHAQHSGAVLVDQADTARPELFACVLTVAVASGPGTSHVNIDEERLEWIADLVAHVRV